jgi:hypothetical protein
LCEERHGSRENKAQAIRQGDQSLAPVGGAFQTRFEDMLIVNQEQLRVLKEAACVASNGTESQPRKSRAAKKK